MKINSKSKWSESQIEEFLSSAAIPMRLSFMNMNDEPMICSLWFKFIDGSLWSASHENSYVVNQLKNNCKVSFEVSTNEYPYKGVRGKASVELSRVNADYILEELIDKYLDSRNSRLVSWLMSRVESEYVLKITPSIINSWDFSDRMEGKASG